MGHENEEDAVFQEVDVLVGGTRNSYRNAYGARWGMLNNRSTITGLSQFSKGSHLGL